MNEPRSLKISSPPWAKPFMAPARYKAAYGGRGSSKSWFFADAMIEAHLLDPNTSSVCLREVQSSIKESVKRLLEQRIETLGVGDYFDVKDTEIRNRRGRGKIVFAGLQSHTAESIKSMEGYDRAWCEEAQTLSQKSLDLLRPTIRKAGSELWFSWNPLLPTDPVDVLLRGAQPPDGAVVVEVNYDQNPWFPDVLRAEMEYDKRRDPDKYAHVWKGGYASSTETRVFRNWCVEDFEAPDDAIFRFGADWGFAVDPTVLVRCWLSGRTLYIDHEAWGLGVEIDRIPHLFLGVPDADRWPIVADGSRPETISYMRRNGYPHIVAAVKGARSIEEGVAFLKSHDIVVHPRCEHTIMELRNYSFRTDKQTGEILPVFEDKHNHVIDALRYACESMRRIVARQAPGLVAPIPTASKWH